MPLLWIWACHRKGERESAKKRMKKITMKEICSSMMKTNSIIFHRFLNLKSNIIICNQPSNTRTVTKRQATLVLTAGVTAKWAERSNRWKKRSTKLRPSNNTFKKTATIITISQPPHIHWIRGALSRQSPTSTMTLPSIRTSKGQMIFIVNTEAWTSHPASNYCRCRLKTLILQIFNRNRANLSNSSHKGLAHRHLISQHPLMKRSNLKANIKMTLKYQLQH